MSLYDAIARLYDPWSRSVTEDVSFYVAEARRVSPGPVVELGVGTGRIAVPIAAEGIRVIGVDSSAGMLEVCRERAESAGSQSSSSFTWATCGRRPSPSGCRLCFARSARTCICGRTTERLGALRAAGELLVPGGRLVFDVFAPGADDIAETDGRWLEREPGDLRARRTGTPTRGR